MLHLNNRIPIIYYHSVGPLASNWAKNFLTLDISIFEKHLKYLSKHYKSITLKQYYNIKAGVEKPIKNPVVITFDDGYLDNWIWAYPLLKKYRLKATIFVSKEFVDLSGVVRPNFADYENGKCSIIDLNRWGFLSWDEMLLMEKSGLIDIQSHTSTHTKYFFSDIIKDIHHPGGDSLYVIGNLYPEKKPYYINDESFEKLIPFGFPIFEERSAVIARKVNINHDFINECVEKFKKYDFNNYNLKKAIDLIKPIYDFYRTSNQIISSVESGEEMSKRLKYEINGSKKEIEMRLNKKVEFLCWPHGDNNEFLHQFALKEGYLMTTTGKAKGVKESDNTRISERIGMDFSRWWEKGKTIFKLKAFSGESPYNILLNTSRRLLRDN